ncbi:MAG TPA: DEAD/DEAH box helicase [Candidatus Cloacimonadota bacterium]|nr:DEAD/DEAH box helicase [Candidatus Cloacimonadota bacterium]
MRPSPHSQGINSFIEELLSLPHYYENIVARQELPEKQAQWSDWPQAVQEGLKATLMELGYTRLYTHQAQAIEAALQGRDLVISTGVASGKSLCYQVPILQDQLIGSKTRALMLFPTKALAQDQRQKTQALLLALTQKLPQAPKLSCGIYDGDTPSEARRQVRSTARIIFSNPDMLHAAILTNQSLWASFFAGLRYVVIDEVHMYRGVFGSHFANVIRRLKRICSIYGSSPQFICTSATVANAFQLASDILERPVKLIDQDGSPHGERLFCLLNPPMISKQLGIRRSSVIESSSLAKRWLKTDGQALLFSISRRSVEILFMYLQNRPDLMSRARSYRSGYLPEERRKIEKELRDREIGLVISTNALELGIDIGGLDAVFMNGYPGTISATRQQAGRAGRIGNSSLCVLVASSNPLDQYICQHPDYLFDNNPEQALIAPDHPEILRQQLLCAVHELALLDGEGFGSLGPEHIFPYLKVLEEDGLIHRQRDRWVGKLEAWPAGEVSLRNISSQMQINCKDQLIGYVDAASALWMTHPGAIYLDRGEMWMVSDLDLEHGKVEVEPVRVNYLTQTTRQSEIELLSLLRREHNHLGSKCFGNVKVTSLITGFKKVRFFTQELVGYEELQLPPSVLETQAWWFSLSQQVVQRVREQGLWRNDPKDYGRDWNRTKDSIRSRDRFRCGHCGAAESGKAFDVHHITPLRMFTDLQAANHPDNLITLCPRCHRLAEEAVRIQSGLAGLAYLLVNLAPFYVMCDRKDIDVIQEERSELAEGDPVIAIYDNIPGGIGLSRKLYELQDRILKEALELAKACPCEDGCPACVGPVAENGAGAKQHAIAILSEMAAPCEMLRR